MTYRSACLAILLLSVFCAVSQDNRADSIRQARNYNDSLFIDQAERKGKPKVLHAEPLYIDLIRDLGARKGEREWNFGMGIKDNLGYDEMEMLIEYEFAPVDRLGFEVELPFSFYSRQKGTGTTSVPAAALNSLKLAGQWSFLVLERHHTSMALGYIHEFTMSSFRDFGRPLFNGHVFNPFFIAAKRWGQNYHTLLYTGPRVERVPHHQEVSFEINSNFHYMIPGSRNFVGLEFNKRVIRDDFDLTIRPQMRVAVAENILVGIVAGIPVQRENQRFSMFTRLIWEPTHKKK